LGILPPVISTPMSFTLLQKGANGSYNDKGLKISAKQKK
jgi:hypothetical protein